MHVGEIWRYPVKSLLSTGIPGDRVVHVRAANGRVITSRNYPHLLGLSGTLERDGEPLVDGVPWCDPRSLRAVRLAA